MVISGNNCNLHYFKTDTPKKNGESIVTLMQKYLKIKKKNWSLKQLTKLQKCMHGALEKKGETLRAKTFNASSENEQTNGRFEFYTESNSDDTNNELMELLFQKTKDLTQTIILKS